jgi:hypothetical protein
MMRTEGREELNWFLIAARIALVLFAVMMSDAKANDIREQPLQRRLDEADIAVVVVGESYKNINGRNGRNAQFGEVRVLYVLKGKAADHLQVMMNDPIVELNPRCCIPGSRYFLLLKRISDSSRYYVVNGRYGAYELEK